MAKEALEKVLTMEKEAEDIIQKAKTRAKEMMDEVTTKALLEKVRILDEAKNQGEALKEKVKLQTEESLKPIREEKLKEIQGIKDISEETLRRTSQLIAERIVGKHGNS